MRPPAAPKNILVCGIPGSGKTNYCDWLEREKGFLHLDFDKLLSGNGIAEKLSLINLFVHDRKDFLKGVFTKNQPIAIDWGFPIKSLPTVRFLKKTGFTVWWFDGDRSASRQAFASRATVPLEAFDAQMDSIEKNWSKIKKVVAGNVIESISAGPTHATSERIFREMF